MGQKTIVAEIVTCTRKEAYLQSPVGTIARLIAAKVASVEGARHIARPDAEFAGHIGDGEKCHRLIPRGLSNNTNEYQAP